LPAFICVINQQITIHQIIIKMKNQKSTPELRNDLKWLKRTNMTFVPQDLLFALCMAFGFMCLFTLFIS